MNFNAQCSDIFLLELASQMSLHEGGLQSELLASNKGTWDAPVQLKQDVLSKTSSSRIIGFTSFARQHMKAEGKWRESASSKRTFPVPPSPTSTSLKLGVAWPPAASAIVADLKSCVYSYVLSMNLVGD